MDTIFVSYAHSSDEHEQRVVNLVTALSGRGLNVVYDGKVTSPQGPTAQWPRWMTQELDRARWVLLVFDECYRRRWDGIEKADKGLGAIWEAGLIINKLYRAATKNENLIPLLVDGDSADLIPDALFGAQRYCIPSQTETLGDALLGKRSIQFSMAASPAPPPVNVPADRFPPSRLRHGAQYLLSREDELARLDAAWADPRTHVVTVVAWGGAGKTSLLVEWMGRLAAEGWPGVDARFDWSFYSQGSRQDGAASAGAFVAEALRFFGDREMAESAKGPWDKGTRLAQLVAEQKALLVLDGLEPLQYPPGPVAGRLKDAALQALLKGLAALNPGLCVVTTRETVTDLAPFHLTTTPQWWLDRLSNEAGAQLLYEAGVGWAGAKRIGPDDGELRAATQEVRGHALTLSLLGNYLARAHGGDIRKRDVVKFREADPLFRTTQMDIDKPYGHAFKVMMAYEKWLEESGEEGQRQLAVLRLMGLFDRPATRGCLAALREKPAIRGLTEPLVGLSDLTWSVTVSFLRDAGLVLGGAEADPSAIDAHPLVRGYFAQRVCDETRAAWRSANRRLYRYLAASTEWRPGTVENVQPLCQAVAHGCRAGRSRGALDEVYRQRLLRLNEDGNGSYFLTQHLGDFGDALCALSCFFEDPWAKPTKSLPPRDRRWVAYQTGWCLRSLTRLEEAIPALQFSREGYGREWDSRDGAIRANTLADTLMRVGWLDKARQVIEPCLERPLAPYWRGAAHVVLAEVLLNQGDVASANNHFRLAEEALKDDNTGLISLMFHPYADLLCDRGALASEAELESVMDRFSESVAEALRAERPKISGAASLGLARLELARHANGWAAEPARDTMGYFDRALKDLRVSGRSELLPPVFIARARANALREPGRIDLVGQDLEAAWQTAARGPMRLHLADIHLIRARLFHTADPYPWISPRDDLAAARALIEECGYHRRDGELADAEKEAEDW